MTDVGEMTMKTPVDALKAIRDIKARETPGDSTFDALERAVAIAAAQLEGKDWSDQIDAPSDGQYIQAAIGKWASDDIEFDDAVNPQISRADGGCWVAGWLWVADDEVTD